MNVNEKITSLLKDIAADVGTISENSTKIGIIYDDTTGLNGQDMATIVVNMPDGAEYKMYSSSSPISLRAYLQGLLHGFELVTGGYDFKPNNDAAYKRKRDSICTWREDSRKLRMKQILDSCESPMPEYGRPITSKTRPNAATSPRFAAFRTRFKE